ncbi:MAG: hypothetical protein IPF70_16275 [Saprospiraceae bacterium]|nr:hypothetical protein [Saprospiraceae bacterium]
MPVDSTSMLIGDRQNLTLSFVSPSSQDKAGLHTEYLDTCSFLLTPSPRHPG